MRRALDPRATNYQTMVLRTKVEDTSYSHSGYLRVDCTGVLVHNGSAVDMVS